MTIKATLQANVWRWIEVYSRVCYETSTVWSRELCKRRCERRARVNEAWVYNNCVQWDLEVFTRRYEILWGPTEMLDCILSHLGASYLIKPHVLTFLAYISRSFVPETDHRGGSHDSRQILEWMLHNRTVTIIILALAWMYNSRPSQGLHCFYIEGKLLASIAGDVRGKLPNSAIECANDRGLHIKTD